MVLVKTIFDALEYIFFFFLSVGFLFIVWTSSFLSNLYKPFLILDIIYLQCQSAFSTHCQMVNI